ncbi:MAG TPA: hypothetical protein VE135_21440 [Pyrinomonadaceae bacterium]|nr:hypothetical protein [Pyrinomonadaceae bacterium]
MNHPSFTISLVITVAALALTAPASSTLDKLKPEEVVAKHLESIGPAEKRAAVMTRIIAGSSLVIFRTVPTGQAAGRAVLASEGIKNLIGMSFQSPVYPREQLGFNGKSFVAAFITPGVRSALGNFLMTHDLVFRQGLMGGVLSSSWPLLDLAVRDARLEYAGTKEINNYTMHELRYLPRGGSDLQIRLYFDSQTFRHLRTEYERVIPAPLDTRDYVNVQEREIRYKMIEEFSVFKNESGLKLPHIYKIKLSVDARAGTFQGEWEINLTQFTFNDKIDPNSFNIGSD